MINKTNYLGMTELEAKQDLDLALTDAHGNLINAWGIFSKGTDKEVAKEWLRKYFNGSLTNTPNVGEIDLNG